MEQPTVIASWHDANQRYLTAALAEVRIALQRHAGAGVDEQQASTRSNDAEALAARMPDAPALEHLCRLFDLSTFERAILLLCAGMELESTFAGLCAAAHGEAQQAYPTFGLALAALPDAHWSALTPAAPLRHWRLIDCKPGSTLTTSPLRIDERVLHYLTGVHHLDEHLVGFVEAVRTDAMPLVPSHQALADQMVHAWTRGTGSALPVLQLGGPDVSAKRTLAAAACTRLGLNLYLMPSSVLPTGPHEFESLVRLWEREAALSNSALLLDAEDLDMNDASRVALVARFVEAVNGPRIITGRERLPLQHRALVPFDVAKPTRREQYQVWEHTFAASGVTRNGQVDRLTDQFDLSAPAIRAACAHAQSQADTSLDDALWQACRTQARRHLDHLVHCITPVATWDDLVLPEAQAQVLRDIVMHVRHRYQVYERWGFAARSNRGLGIAALFAGPSGTGKTMAAEVIAHTLNLDLYHIDLSQIVSKYIGETEKNLRRVFDAAEEGGAVLLFDEADALFGKRSDVKDSHDRYANIEVSYLLQRIETYRGLAILTTNLKNAIDDAFQRRLRFAVSFPFPDPALRAEIWRRIFPPDTPTEGLDVNKLARLNATGGTIRSVALHAAFLAADAGEPVRMTHVLRAAHRVYAKLEKPLTDNEIRGWL